MTTKYSFCKFHTKSPLKTVCCHIKNAINNRNLIKGYEFSQELFLLTRYYSKVWLCHDCLVASNLPAIGAIFFSQQLRDIMSRLNDEEFDQPDDFTLPLIEDNISQGLTSVCGKCFDELVLIETSNNQIPELPIPITWVC